MDVKPFAVPTNEGKHHPAEQQSFYQAPAITQPDQLTLCSSPAAPRHLTLTGEKPNKGEFAAGAVSPGAVFHTRSPAATLLRSHRASLLSAGLPGSFLQDRAGQPRQWLQQKEPQTHTLSPRPSGPAPPAQHPHLSGRTWCGPRAAARRGPASLPSLRPPGPRGNAGERARPLTGRDAAPGEGQSSSVTVCHCPPAAPGAALGKELTVKSSSPVPYKLLTLLLFVILPPRLVSIQKVL